MNLEQLEADVRRLAEQLEPGGADRILLGYLSPRGLLLRRLAMTGSSWIDVGAEMAGKLGPAAERMLDVLWPDCEPELRRTIVMGASLVGKIPFLWKKAA